jgi:CBS domain-containing protein
MSAVADHPSDGGGRVRRIPVRVPAQVDGLASLRVVARCMADSGVGAVLVENRVGPVGLVTAKDVIEAVAAGADPDVVWAGEVMRPAPRVVSCEQHPADVGAEMAAYELEVVAVVDEDTPLGVASALDVLGAVIRVVRDTKQSGPDRR